MGTGQARGSKPLSRRDWLYGSRPRRLLIERAVLVRPPEDGWTKTDLAERASVSPNGGVDEHVAGLRDLGLLVEDRGRWSPATPRPALAGALRLVTRALAASPDERHSRAPLVADDRRRAVSAVRQAMTLTKSSAARLSEEDRAAALEYLRLAAQSLGSRR